MLSSGEVAVKPEIREELAITRGILLVDDASFYLRICPLLRRFVRRFGC